jgi:ADP-heptose:LPS heptosyltransferase
LLLKFLHGLGDSVQATIVLQHLTHYHPDWQIDFAALYGKHSAARELCRNVLVIDGNNRSIPGAQTAYHRTLTLEWDENREAHADWPSTKPIRCLRQVFQLTPILELCRYKIARSEEADRRARSYLEEICPERRSDGRFPVVLLHYQGNTSCDRKDLTHDHARRICEAVRQAGQIPVILDWDNRSPLIDQKHIFNPDASHALWHNRGTGDAEILAALIEGSSLMIGIDSGPLHVAGATTTPTLGVWTWHHPVHYFDLAPNVLHLVPGNHSSLAFGSAAVEFFEQNYSHAVYNDLATAVIARIRPLEDGHSCPSGLGVAEFERSQQPNDRAGIGSKDQVVFAREQHCFSEDSAAVADPITIEIAHVHLDASTRTSTGLTIPDRTSITAEPVAAIAVSNFTAPTVVTETRTVNRRAPSPPLRAKAVARTPRPCCGGAKQSAAKREDSTAKSGSV